MDKKCLHIGESPGYSRHETIAWRFRNKGAWRTHGLYFLSLDMYGYDLCFMAPDTGIDRGEKKVVYSDRFFQCKMPAI